VPPIGSNCRSIRKRTRRIVIRTNAGVTDKLCWQSIT
jgi:hypothetical protein